MIQEQSVALGHLLPRLVQISLEARHGCPNREGPGQHPGVADLSVYALGFWGKTLRLFQIVP